jgi:protein-S-isoprenylcysteine O-methyltransferase Ste14
MASLRRSTVVSVLFTLFGGPGIILFWVPLAITRFHLPGSESLGRKLAASALILLGLIPLFDSILRFVRVGRGTLMPNVPTERLVVSGLYRHVRNPMYVGDFTVLLGEALLFRSAGVLLWAACVLAVLQTFILRYEEPTLLRRHPEDYPAYKQNVPRWLPRLSAWRQ